MSEVPYLVSSGYLNEVSARMIIASLSNIEDTRTVAEKMESLGFTIQDYLDLAGDPRFLEALWDYNIKIQIVPGVPRFLRRHMEAAMKGGRGSAKIVKWALGTLLPKLQERGNQTNIQINNSKAATSSTEDLVSELRHLKENVAPDLLSAVQDSLDKKGELSKVARSRMEIILDNKQIEGEVIRAVKEVNDKGTDQPRAGSGHGPHEPDRKGTRAKKRSNKDGGLQAPSGTS